MSAKVTKTKKNQNLYLLQNIKTNEFYEGIFTNKRNARKWREDDEVVLKIIKTEKVKF